MFTTHDLLWGIVYPAIFAIVAPVVGRFTQRSKREAAPWAVALAIVGPFAVAFLGLNGKSFVPPTQAQEWLPIMGLASIVTAIIAMVHKLRMSVVAEGVEDERTLMRLADLGADLAQGYWMSRPIPAAEIRPWIERWTAGTEANVVPLQRAARAIGRADG